MFSWLVSNILNCCVHEGDHVGHRVDDINPVTDDGEPLRVEVSDHEHRIQSMLRAIGGHRKEEPGEKVFMAILRKKKVGESLGLTVDFADERCGHVTKVSIDTRTPVAFYNDAAPASRRIKPGDFLLSVNGISADCLPEGKPIAAAFKEQFHHDTIQLLVSRPVELAVKVDRRGLPLGLDLSYSRTGKSLVVEQILEGAVEADFPEVQPFDHIVSVNGVEGGYKVLTQAILDTSDVVTIKVTRPHRVDEEGHRIGTWC